jgi:hypothetical protein
MFNDNGSFLVALFEFSLFFAWLVYLIARGTGMQQRQLEQVKEAQAAQAEYVRAVAARSTGSPADEIASAKSLLDSGAVSQADYEALKARALA